MNTYLIGDTAIVTSASRGIGRAVALHLHDRGANVVFGVRRPDQVTLPPQISASPRVLLAPLDVTDRDQVAAVIDTTIARFGTVDILVNNAGVDEPGAILDLTDEHLDRVWSVNVRGLLLCTQYAAR